MIDVLHVIDSLASDGAQTSYLSMVPSLLRHGIQPSILALSDHPSSIASRFEEAGAPVQTLEPQSGRLRTALAIQRVLARRKPQVVHTVLFEADICTRIACLESSVPIVTTLANVSYGTDQQRHFRSARWKIGAARALDVLTAPRTSVFHSVAEHVARDMAARLRVSPARIRVIPRGRDDQTLGRRSPERARRTRERLGCGDAQIILGIGRHSPQKALLVFLEVFERVAAHNPSVVAFIAGREGEETEKLHELKGRLKAGDRIFLLGSRSDVPDLLATADVMLFPSRWEGMPGAVLESMALEAPLVASDIDPVREIVPDAGAQFVQTDDVEGFARAVSDTLADPDAARVRAQRSRAAFEAKFTIERAASGMADLYRSLL